MGHDLPNKKNSGIPAVIPVRYCLYARKSTESEERQVLSIDSQIKEMLALAKKEGLEVVEIKKEAHSAKATGQRPIFNELLHDIRKGHFNGILTWAPDRIARNAGDLGAVVDLMDQKLLLQIRTYGQQFTDNPNEKFLLMILGSQAKLENDNRGINVKRGLRAKVEMGLWPGTAPTGYLNEKNVDKKCHVIVDPVRGTIIRQMFEKVGNEQWSGLKLYHWMIEEINFKTKNGKHLSLGNIYLILKSPFYNGVFEYPKNSGNWYTGQHTPLVSKELFQKVQERLTRDLNKKTWGSKEFAFTKLMVCGQCDSGITAMEKYKKQENGNVHHYIYYGCSRSKDKHCKNRYTREEVIIESLITLINEIDLDEMGIRKKVKQEVERYRKFQGILGKGEARAQRSIDIDIREYVVYVLKNGTLYEKRELLSCLKSRLVLIKHGVRLTKINIKPLVK